MLTPEPGTIVGEKYRILRLLGEGGMGTVYEAENTLTLKRAAIKRLHPRLVAVEEAGKRLLHEARAMARIHHRNVVDIYDVVLEASSVFLVMELLRGEQLSDWLTRESLSMHEVVALLLPAMRGVAAAHAAGVIHRDIKPDNIFLVREPGSDAITPKVIDFGISRLFEADGGRLTRSGMTMGTPRYVSYEQLRGMRDVDQRADIYAFGVILYECLVGQPPYVASTFAEQAISFVTTEPASPRELRPEVPEQLDALVRVTIAKERDQRPATMQALIAGLEPFAEPQSYAAPLRVFPPRGPVPRTPEVFPDQTTAPATSTPLPELRQPAQGGSEATPSLPTPKGPIPGQRTRRARQAAFGAGLALTALLLLFWLGEWSRPAAPASVPTGSAPSEHAQPAVAAPPPLAPAAAGDLALDAALVALPDAASSSEAPQALVPARTGQNHPARAYTEGRARRRAGASRMAPSASPPTALPAPKAGEIEPKDQDGEPRHRAGGMRSDEF